MSLIEEGKEYTRNTNKKRKELELAILKEYSLPLDEYGVEITASGITALSACLYTLSKDLPREELSIAFLKDAYMEFPDIINTFFNSPTFIDLNNINNTTAKILFIESCSNPKGEMVDFDLIKMYKATNKNSVIICDNTWLSPILFNPFDYGVDIVADSLTKYTSGGKCIGGSIIARKKFIEKVNKNFTQIFGQFIGSDHCDIFLNEIKYLKNRINHVSEIALDISRYILSRNVYVYYPLLSKIWQNKTRIWDTKNVNYLPYHTLVSRENDNFNVAIKFLKKGPGSLCFKPNKMPKECDERLKVSFGTSDTRIEIINGLLRLSIGYESTFKDVLKIVNLYI